MMFKVSPGPTVYGGAYIIINIGQNNKLFTLFFK